MSSTVAPAANNLNTLVTVERDRWGRYLIPDPVTGKKRAWTRATTLASTLSDKFGLQQWAQRMTARGLVLRPDLFALAASCDPDDKKRLNSVVEDAKEAAASSSGANLGTALHSFTEALDRGEVVRAPAPWDADLAAYKTTLDQAGIVVDPAYVEIIVTLAEHGVAGTFDRLVDIGGTLTVADLKTGSFLDWHEISIQLALYAHAGTIYNPTTGEHTPMPQVDQNRALVIHLPAGKATCELWVVDIAQGWEAAQQALAVREWRNRKNLAGPLRPQIVAPRPASPVTLLLEAQTAWLRDRVQNIVGALDSNPLPAPWPAWVPTFKQGGPTELAQCDALAAWCARCETHLRLPFPDEAPHHIAYAQFVDGMTDDELAELGDGTRPVVARLGATDVARILEQLSNTPNNNKEKETNQ